MAQFHQHVAPTFTGLLSEDLEKIVLRAVEDNAPYTDPQSQTRKALTNSSTLTLSNQAVLEDGRAQARNTVVAAVSRYALPRNSLYLWLPCSTAERYSSPSVSFHA